MRSEFRSALPIGPESPDTSAIHALSARVEIQVLTGGVKSATTPAANPRASAIHEPPRRGIVEPATVPTSGGSSHHADVPGSNDRVDRFDILGSLRRCPDNRIVGPVRRGACLRVLDPGAGAANRDQRSVVVPIVAIVVAVPRGRPRRGLPVVVIIVIVAVDLLRGRGRHRGGPRAARGGRVARGPGRCR